MGKLKSLNTLGGMEKGLLSLSTGFRRLSHERLGGTHWASPYDLERFLYIEGPLFSGVTDQLMKRRERQIVDSVGSTTTLLGCMNSHRLSSPQLYLSNIIASF